MLSVKGRRSKVTGRPALPAVIYVGAIRWIALVKGSRTLSSFAGPEYSLGKLAHCLFLSVSSDWRDALRRVRQTMVVCGLLEDPGLVSGRPRLFLFFRFEFWNLIFVIYLELALLGFGISRACWNIF